MSSLRKSATVASWLFAGGLMSAAMASADTPPRIEVTEAKFKIDLGGGRILQGMDLVGVILHLRNRAAEPIEIRIDSVTPTGDPMSGIELYGLSRRGAGGAWSPLCKSGADGRALGFPLPGPGTDDADAEATGSSFSIACTAGARGKCVMLGYRPWTTAAGGGSLRPYFDSCVRMMRADYCGDGRSHTRAGVHVDMWDRAGVQEAQTDLPFEAAWGPAGALCLAHARVPGVSTMENVLAICPRLAARPAGDCESWSRQSDSGALIWNRSAIGD